MAWKRVYFLALLLLSGCFQQAGEALQPADNTSVPLPVDAPTLSDVNVTPIGPADATTRFPATSTFPPITVISPATLTPSISTQTGDVEITSSPQDNTLDTVPTQVFITPGGPSGPVPTNTPIPTLGGSTIATPSGLITPTAPSTGSADGCTYTVQPGDNLYRISVNHNLTMDEMREANPELAGEAPILQPGQQLQIPGCGNTSTASDNGSTPVPPADDGSGDTTTTTGSGTSYTVQNGDTLYSIARQFGVTVQAIVNANSLANPNSLSVGQTLVIPPSS